jgi:hypothetical protein
MRQIVAGEGVETGLRCRSKTCPHTWMLLQHRRASCVRPAINGVECRHWMTSECTDDSRSSFSLSRLACLVRACSSPSSGITTRRRRTNRKRRTCKRNKPRKRRRPEVKKKMGQVHFSTDDLGLPRDRISMLRPMSVSILLRKRSLPNALFWRVWSRSASASADSRLTLNSSR